MTVTEIMEKEASKARRVGDLAPELARPTILLAMACPYLYT